MVKYNKISSDQAATAKKTDSTTVGTALKARHDSILAPHFAMYVLQQAADQYGEETIQNTGMTIITTLDYSKQQVAQQSIDDNKNNLKKYAAQNAAVVSVDPKTGQILAMVGSADYFDTSIDGNVNVADSLRQPGSSFKVFEYSTLLKQNYSPSKILYDFQTDFGGGYTPKNYNGKFNGPVTVRYALQNSLNIPAVKALALAGIDNTIQTAKDFGITSITKSANYYGLSMALGTAEVKPVEMASAYGTLANQGVHEELTPFIKITDSTGKVLYDFDKDHPKGTQVIDPQVAYEMANILSDNASRTPTFGGRSALYFSDRTVAAKTGTTQENRDGWTCGFTPSIATAVWTGNNMPSPMKTDAVNIAGPIFHAFMTKALAGTPNEAFAQPTGIQSLTVEKYSSKLPDQYSSETTTDIFATWQVPKDTEDTYKKVTVCKGTNLVAPENTDSALTEIKVFADLHSEQPNNPNWENPVRAWATQNNLAVNVPTDKCNPASLAPTISITNPSNNSTVSGTTAITVSTTSPSGTQKVSYSLDDVSIGESASSPYSLTFDFSSIADGKHTLSAQITDSNGMTAKSTVSIIISDNGVKISQLLTKVVGTTATVTWTTSSAASSSVLYSHDGGSPLEESSTTLTTTHSVTLSGLVTGKIYNITVSSKDASNNVGSQTANFST